MRARRLSTIADRLELIRLRYGEGLSRRAVGGRLGYSRKWVRHWSRRYRQGGEAALQARAHPRPGPLAEFGPAVGRAVVAYRRRYPRIGARRARVVLEQDPTLRGERLPSVRTIERAWKQAGLLTGGPPTTKPPPTPALPPAQPHAVWQLDHQDHLSAVGIGTGIVLQSTRDPHAALTIGADVFWGPGGAYTVAEDLLFDALRRRFVQWGLPQAISVDRGVRFLGQAQRTFPSRFELLCVGWGISVHQIRPGRPTDQGAVERLHQTLDAVFVGPSFDDLPALQAALNTHQADLNERFPSRAKGCHGRPPLIVHPLARHSGRSYDPAREWDTFDLAAVHRFLATWKWYRTADKQGAQVSFGHRNYGLGKAYRGMTVALRFLPDPPEVVVYELGSTPDDLGPEIRRFPCPFFEKGRIWGYSTVAWRPPGAGVHDRDAPPLMTGGPSL
jgi:hypothetical protein